MTATPTPVDRRLYGDLADDVVLLRSDGRVVARFKGGFRVDSHPEIFTAAQVRGMAAEVRNRRESKPVAPRSRMARHEITKRREGTPAGESEGTVDTPRGPGGALATPSKAGVRGKYWRAAGPTKSCGIAEGREEETHNSHPVGRSGAVAAPAGVESGPQDLPVHRPKSIEEHFAAVRAEHAAEIAAVRAELAAFKATVRAAVADLVAHIGLGDGR